MELIVLNIGLQAGILDTRTFSMFVVHALVLTFVTTPLVLAFYPPKYRVHKSAEKPAGEESLPRDTGRHGEDGRKLRFAVILDKIESLSAAMTISSLLPPSIPSLSQDEPLDEKAEMSDTESLSTPRSPSTTIQTLRLMELTDRTSAMLRSQEADSLIHNDPVLTAYRTFGRLNALNVKTKLSVVSQKEFPDAIAKHAAETRTELAIVMWPRGITSVLEGDSNTPAGSSPNPLDGIFHRTTTEDQTSSVVYPEYIRNVFMMSPCDVALFVERGSTSSSINTTHQHIFLPFFGGPDDRLALSFLVQLCENTSVTATAIRFIKPESSTEEVINNTLPPAPISTIAAVDTVYGNPSTQTRLASDTADHLLWQKYTSTASSSHSPAVVSALSRISFKNETHPAPISHAIALIKQETTSIISRADLTLIVLAGRSRRMGADILKGELSNVISDTSSAVMSSVSKTLGDVGAALVASRADASLLIVQAAQSS